MSVSSPEVYTGRELGEMFIYDFALYLREQKGFQLEIERLATEIERLETLAAIQHLEGELSYTSTIIGTITRHRAVNQGLGHLSMKRYTLPKEFKGSTLAVKQLPDRDVNVFPRSMSIGRKGMRIKESSIVGILDDQSPLSSYKGGSLNLSVLWGGNVEFVEIQDLVSMEDFLPNVEIEVVQPVTRAIR